MSIINHPFWGTTWGTSIHGKNSMWGMVDSWVYHLFLHPWDPASLDRRAASARDSFSSFFAWNHGPLEDATKKLDTTIVWWPAGDHIHLRMHFWIDHRIIIVHISWSPEKSDMFGDHFLIFFGSPEKNPHSVYHGVSYVENSLPLDHNLGDLLDLWPTRVPHLLKVMVQMISPQIQRCAWQIQRGK